eukprot:2018365-Amphidinium_carterae.1
MARMSSVHIGTFQFEFAELSKNIGSEHLVQYVGSLDTHVLQTTQLSSCICKDSLGSLDTRVLQINQFAHSM